MEKSVLMTEAVEYQLERTSNYVWDSY